MLHTACRSNSRKFSLFGSRALNRNFLISRFMPRNHTHQFAYENTGVCMGVYPSGFNFHVLLPSKNTKFCTPQKFPAIRYIVQNQLVYIIMLVPCMMCSDTKEYPLKLSGYSRVQIPLACTFMYPIQARVHWLWSA